MDATEEDYPFWEAVKNVRGLICEPNNDTKLELYGLYKQRLFGDNSRRKNLWRTPKDQKKFEAWESKRGLQPKVASKLYIRLVKKLVLEDTKKNISAE